MYKAKKFKKNVVSGLWTVLMHFILRGLSGKHGGTYLLSKAWWYVVYNILLGKNNAVDLTEVLRQDFQKFSINRKSREISRPRFWALTIQQHYRERKEPVPIDTISKKLFLSFKAIKYYHLPDQIPFGPTRRLPVHMLAKIPSDCIHLKQHL